MGAVRHCARPTLSIRTASNRSVRTWSAGIPVAPPGVLFVTLENASCRISTARISVTWLIRLRFQSRSPWRSPRCEWNYSFYRATPLGERRRSCNLLQSCGGHSGPGGAGSIRRCLVRSRHQRRNREVRRCDGNTALYGRSRPECRDDRAQVQWQNVPRRTVKC